MPHLVKKVYEKMTDRAVRYFKNGAVVA
jgi:hypothetical protein